MKKKNTRKNCYHKETKNYQLRVQNTDNKVMESILVFFKNSEVFPSEFPENIED